MRHPIPHTRETQEDFGLVAAVDAGGCAPPVYVLRHPSGKHPDSILPTPERGARSNKGKPRVGLLIPKFLLAMGAVLTMGVEKYKDPDNWKKGMPVREIMDSALRHIYAFMDGEDNDAESKQPHLAHAAVNLMFAFWMVLNRPKFDDRRYPAQVTES